MTSLSVEDIANNKGISIGHWNCRSIFNKMTEITHIMINGDLEIGIFSESWLCPSITNDMIDIPKYNIFRLDRGSNSRKRKGDGIVVYAKDQLKLRQIETLSKCTMAVEYVTLRLDLVNVKEIYIIAVYRPPNSSVPDFINEMEAVIHNLSDKVNIEVNLIGDVNINVKKPRDINTRRYLDFLKRQGLFNVINEETHINMHDMSGSIIDHFCTTDNDLYAQWGVCHNNVSDHSIIFASRKKFKIK